jgi:hypothetical protein
MIASIAPRKYSTSSVELASRTNHIRGRYLASKVIIKLKDQILLILSWKTPSRPRGNSQRSIVKSE